MFDFSFGEIGVVAVIALLVLGPERLPKVARTAGALVRRARTSWQSVRDEIERELAAEDMKRSLQEARQAAADLRNEFASSGAEIKSHADSVMTSLKPPIAEDVPGESATMIESSKFHPTAGDGPASNAGSATFSDALNVDATPEPARKPDAASASTEPSSEPPRADPRDAR